MECCAAVQGRDQRKRRSAKAVTKAATILFIILLHVTAFGSDRYGVPDGSEFRSLLERGHLRKSGYASDPRRIDGRCSRSVAVCCELPPRATIGRNSDCKTSLSSKLTYRFIAYSRVFADLPSKSGLRPTVSESHVGPSEWRNVGADRKFVEVASGKDSEQPRLTDALEACQV
jgi:hypothetical protein